MAGGIGRDPAVSLWRLWRGLSVGDPEAPGTTSARATIEALPV